jgi:hypothetical protein
MNKSTLTVGEPTAINENKHERMTFFRSFRDGLATLGSRNRLLACDALFDYGFDNIRRQNLPREVEAILRMAIPQINASHRRQREGMKNGKYGILGADSGKYGGRPKNEGVIVELNADGEIDKDNLS